MKFKLLKTIGIVLTVAAWLLTASWQSTAWADSLWPENPPSLGLLQTRSVFSLMAARHLESLIVQHEHLTGERILLVVRPWSGAQADAGAQELAQALSDRWRLDITRRGTGVILVLQEDAPGKLAIGYRPGVGLTKPQTASSEDLEKLQELVNSSSAAGSWDQIAETSGTWLFQSLASPLLENPNLLSFPQKAEELARPDAVARPRPKNGSRNDPGSGVWIFFFVATALALVIEAIRRGLKPQVLMGARRAVRFGLLDHARELLAKLLRSSRGDQNSSLQIESLGGSR